MSQTSYLIPLNNKQTVELSSDTDAATLAWVLNSGIVKYDTPQYEFIRSVVRRRFGIGLTEFKKRQEFPQVPPLSSEEYLLSLPEEAYDHNMWAHPILWVVHSWADSGEELRPLVSSYSCRSDLEAAIYIVSKNVVHCDAVVTQWIRSNFNLDKKSFHELFVKTSILSKLNYYSRRGSEATIVRYRDDVNHLLSLGHSLINKGESSLTSAIHEFKQTKNMGNDGELSLFIRECERVLESWQTLRAQSGLRQQPRIVKK